MKRILAILYWSSVATFVSGCALDAGSSFDDEAVAEDAIAVKGPHALNPNALNPNALNPNALNPNALNPNALNPNALGVTALSAGALGPSALAALQEPGNTGAMSRQLLSYSVSCALGPAQSFSFTWYDNQNVPHPETYWGLLALAPSWATEPLDSTGQQWVSACLASRTNWYGVPVMLSSRGPHASLETTSPSEQLLFPTEEGAFFGNLFRANPAVYACHIAANEAHVRSLYRDCAAGHIDSQGKTDRCGPIQIVGDCADFCAPLDADGLYYPSCSSTIGGWTTTRVITTFLP
jgi:hypothetical protein